MSIIRMLTRLSAVAALRGRTWAGDRVFDSDNTPLSQALALNEAAKPYIVVYTDSDTRTEWNGSAPYSTRRELSLILEIGVASKIKGETGDAMLQIPLTDEGMEIALDMVEDQTLAALLGDPQSDWAEVFRGFIFRIDRMNGQRGASADRDRRWAARQLGITCDVVSDMPPGIPVPPNHPIYKFIEAAKAHPEAHMDHAAEICEAILSRSAAPQWEQVQAALGVRRVGLRAIGLAPLSGDLPNIGATQYGDDLTDTRGEAPILREITYDDIDMEGDDRTGLVDNVKITTNVVVIKPIEKKDKVEVDGNETGP